MDLPTKPDFEACLDRVEAWWDCRIIDRPPVTIRVQPDGPPKRTVPDHPGPLRDRWLDAEYHVDCMEAAAENGVYLAETVRWAR